jgi:hypothetical protein
MEEYPRQQNHDQNTPATIAIETIAFETAWIAPRTRQTLRALDLTNLTSSQVNNRRMFREILFTSPGNICVYPYQFTVQ